jgi:hypothetical protein
MHKKKDLTSDILDDIWLGYLDFQDICPALANTSKVYIHKWKKLQLCGQKHLATTIVLKFPLGNVVNKYIA